MIVVRVIGVRFKHRLRESRVQVEFECGEHWCYVNVDDECKQRNDCARAARDGPAPPGCEDDALVVG